jgi:hypothetical protein
MNEDTKQQNKTSPAETSKLAVSATEITASTAADSGDGAVEITNAKAPETHMTIDKKDATKQSGSSPTWLEIDIVGLRRTLERKGKAWAIFELVQNAWDTDASRVDVTLSKPNKNGMSTLTCRDNAPEGYRDLSEAHTLFGSSSKKADPTKRGRFNAGEKFVLVMCESATVTSTTGQIVFQSNGKRKQTDVHTAAGTEFQGVLEMTQEEWVEVGRQVRLLLPPITTTYNGVEVPMRKPLKSFEDTLPTEVASERGVLTPRKRKTEVRIYEPQSAETPMLYERGIPVVEMEGKYHVSVEQKIPLNTERDNVTPSYLRALHTVVAGQTFDMLTQEDTNKTWVREAVETGRLKPEVVKVIAQKRFGEKAVLKDYSDIGSNKEATSKGANVLGPGAPSPAERKVFAETGASHKAGDIADYKTIGNYPPAKNTKDPGHYDEDEKVLVRLIEIVSPILINHAVTVKVVNDPELLREGCTRWRKDSFEFEINLAWHDIHSWTKNYELLLHELAHHTVQSNDHLCHEFYDAVTIIGAKLAQAALERPELFPTSIAKPELVAA